MIPGAAAVYTISVAAQGSFSGAVSLSMGAIAGASASLSSSTVQPGASVTLTVNTFSTTVLGPASIPVTAIAGSITQTATLTLSVQALTVNPVNPTTATVPPVLANSTPVPATYNFNAGSGTWITASSCSTNDPNVTVGVSNQTSSQATITYTANALTRNRIVAASCTYTCPGGTGPITFPPVTVSPAPVIFPNGVTDLENNPNPTVYAGVPTTILIHGEYFGTTQGNIGLCLAGANPCVFPSSVPCNLPPSGTLCSTISLPQPWTDALIEATITLPSGAIGAWDLYVISNAWIQGSAATDPSRGIFNVQPLQPSVRITSRPISITASSTPGQYIATLTSAASPAGGSYTWSTNNTNMVGFITPPSGPSASQVTLGILSTNNNATITLSYVGPYGGSATDSFTFALTNDTVAVAWVDSSKIMPDSSTLPLGILDPIVQTLNNSISCATTVLLWGELGGQGAGSASNGLIVGEIVYANQFLLSRTGNPAPPQQMTDNVGFVMSGDYRMYQRLQASYELTANAINSASVRYLNGPYVTEGTTPEPCSGLQLFSLPVQKNAADGNHGTASDGSLVYQINETRLGPEGQAVNQFLNGIVGQDSSEVTAWIWSVIQFDVNGMTRAWQQGANTNNLQIFPTYQIYTNGFGLTPTVQGNLSTFIGLNATSYYTGQQ